MLTQLPSFINGNGFGGNFCADVNRRNYDLPEGFVLTAIDELIMKLVEKSLWQSSKKC